MTNKTFLKRKGRKNRHHNKAKSRGGTRTPKNLFLLDENRHAAFHLIFSNRIFIEAAKVLVRAHNMKNKTNIRIG